MSVWPIVIPPIAGAGLCAWSGFHPRARLFGPIVSNAGTACALTFDDGPNPGVTPRLLSLLEKYRVPATFFVLGKYVEKNRTLTADMAAAGHAIGNHTHSHPSLLFFSRQRIVDELNCCEDAIHKAIGKGSTCVRPPFGFRGPQFFRAARAVGLPKVIMWSVSARDWSPQPWNKVSGRLRKVRRGDVMLFHDGSHRIPNSDRSHTLKALEFWLPRWKDSGLEFVSFG